MRETGQSTWQDAASPVPGPEYRPNEAFTRALSAKRLLDQKMWPGPGR